MGPAALSDDDLKLVAIRDGRALVPLTVFGCPKFRDDVTSSDRVLHPGVYPVTHDGPGIRLHGPRVHRIYHDLRLWRAKKNKLI